MRNVRKRVGWVVFALVVSFHTPVSWAYSGDQPTSDGPSLEETVAFIRDSMVGCGKFSGKKVETWRGADGSPFQMTIIIETKVIGVSSPNATKVEVQSRSREKLVRGDFSSAVASSVISADVLPLESLSPDVSVEKSQFNLHSILLKCTQGACIQKIKTNLEDDHRVTQSFKPLEELLIPKHHSEEKESSNEAVFSLCSKAVADSLAKAFNHAITKAGGKKPLF